MSTINLTLELPVERIKDLVTSALDSPWSWILSVQVVDAKIMSNLPWKSCTRPEAYVFHDRYEGTNHTLDRWSIEAGLKVFASKYPQHFGNWLTERDDSETANVFLQCCLFGDLIYC